MRGTRYRWPALVLLLVTMSVIVWTLRIQQHQQHQEAGLAGRLKQINGVGSEAAVSCSEVAASRPLVLLALGQSNAANHGSPERAVREPIMLIADGRCIRAVDPLPGGTGIGGSIWRRLPDALRSAGIEQPIVISILAVDASSINEWTRQESALRQRLVEHLASLRGLRLLPDFVLWQQGEADAIAGTSSSDYAQQLDRLAAIVDQAGAKAPIIVARSTICRSAPSQAVRSAIEAKASTDRRFRLGPDTDVLAGSRFRHDECHLSADGLDAASRMWATALAVEVARTPMPPQ